MLAKDLIKIDNTELTNNVYTLVGPAQLGYTIKYNQ